MLTHREIKEAIINVMLVVIPIAIGITIWLCLGHKDIPLRDLPDWLQWVKGF